MEYTILEERNTADLKSSVNAAIAEGWRPLGGVAASIDQRDLQTDYFYTQAMVKDPDYTSEEKIASLLFDTNELLRVLRDK